MRVELGDATTAADPADVHSICRSFPLTYGQPLAHFLRATSKVPDAQVITDHPAVRYVLGPGDLSVSSFPFNYQLLFCTAVLQTMCVHFEQGPDRKPSSLSNLLNF